MAAKSADRRELLLTRTPPPAALLELERCVKRLKPQPGDKAFSAQVSTQSQQQNRVQICRKSCACVSDFRSKRKTVNVIISLTTSELLPVSMSIRKGQPAPNAFVEDQGESQM